MVRISTTLARDVSHMSTYIYDRQRHSSLNMYKDANDVKSNLFLTTLDRFRRTVTWLSE